MEKVSKLKYIKNIGTMQNKTKEKDDWNNSTEIKELLDNFRQPIYVTEVLEGEGTKEIMAKTLPNLRKLQTYQ